MARRRFNNISSFGTTNPITLSSSSATSCSWSSAPNLPTIAAPDYVVIVAEPDTANEEIMYLTAYTSGATSGTVTRAQEGTTGIAHAATAWVHAPTAADFFGTASLTTPVVNSSTTEVSYMQGEIPTTVAAGAVFDIDAWAVASSFTSDVFTWRIRVGTTTLTGNIASSVAKGSGGFQNIILHIIGKLTVITVGSSGTAIGAIQVISVGTATGVGTADGLTDVHTTTVAINTTNANIVEVTGQAGTSGDTCTVYQCTIRQVA